MEDHGFIPNTPKENKVQQKDTNVPFKELSITLLEGRSHPLFRIAIVREIALLQHRSISGFGRVIQTDRTMASKILSGAYIPKKISTIEKIAAALHIPPIILGGVFKDLKDYKEKGERK